MATGESKRRMIDSAWFRRILRQREMSIRQFAAKLGMHYSSVSRLLNGERKMIVTEAEPIAALLGVSVMEVVSHAGLNLAPPEVEAKLIPLVGTVYLGEKMDINPGRPMDRIPAPPEMADDATALIVRTSAVPSMRAWAGSVIFVAPADNEYNYCIDRLCLVDADVPMLARVHRGYRSGRYNLTRIDGGDEVAGVKLTTCMPVLWVRP